MVYHPERNGKKLKIVDVLYKKGFIYVSDFFHEDEEFIKLNDFNVNLPFTIILGLKRVLCLFVNNVNKWDKMLPILASSITNLVFINSCKTCTRVKHEKKFGKLDFTFIIHSWKATYNALLNAQKAVNC